MEAKAFGAVRIAVMAYELALSWVQSRAAAALETVRVAGARAQGLECLQAIRCECIHAWVRRTRSEHEVAAIVGELEWGQQERPMPCADPGKFLLDSGFTRWRGQMKRGFNGGVQTVTPRLGNKLVPVIRRQPAR